MEMETKEWLDILKRIEDGTGSDTELQRYLYLCDLRQEKHKLEFEGSNPFKENKERFFTALERKIDRKNPSVRRKIISISTSIAASIFLLCFAAVLY